MRLSPFLQEAFSFQREIRNGRAFGGSTHRGAILANHSHVQLWNPVGSGKTAIVRAFNGSHDTAGRIVVASASIALNALSGNAPVNLLFGGVASLLELRTEVNVAALGNQIFNEFVAANDALRSTHDYFCLLGQGTGLTLLELSTNIALSAWWQWVEF